MNKEVTVVMLAGGVGKRFWPLTTHKTIFPFFGKPLIEFNLEKLKTSGFKNILIVINPSDEKVIKQIKINGLNISISIQPEPTGMDQAILTIKNQLGQSPVLIMNAEDLVDTSLYKEILISTKLNKPMITTKPTDKYFDGGYLTFNKSKLTGIKEKPGAGKEPSNLINLVYHYFPNAGIITGELAKLGKNIDYRYEVALAHLIKKTDFSLIKYNGPWIPVKYPWQVLDVFKFLFKENRKSYRGKNILIKQNVIIEGDVYIGDNVRIFENTKIIGPVYIGANTIIGNNNLIRESHIGENCVTGFNTDITRSYIGKNCWFHSNYIGDSVLEDNISLGSGANLANLRLDEQEIFSVINNKKISTNRNKLGAIIGSNTRLGINTSIMPGIKIGRNSFIGSGICIDKDIADYSFCMGVTNYQVTKNKKTATGSREQFKNMI